MVNIIASPYVKEDIIKLKAAGANSVVLGMPFFSVRSTSHFDNETLKEVRIECRKEGLACYVLMNRFFVESELEKLRIQLAYLKEINVDGIYFSDMGVFYEAQKLALEDKMMYNPDTILTNSADVLAYMDLGMKMCTLAKEITLEDMVKIGNKVQSNVEVIIHGRLNMMHSKRDLLTNYMHFIKQEHHLKDKTDLYLMEENREEHMPIIEDEHGTHIFTGFTLCSFEEVEDLIHAHINNLRIESMFYSIDEVCAIIKDYRKVIDHLADGRAMFKLYEQQYPNQNITKGFLYKKTGLRK
ncbi:MAG: U32 family peptidase [Erysipelotrichia bacterium]|nr:U32 family peptidase [Erysipelotrichia bacterium]NCC55176.1 U32 family peptidase [Erysipelotrichia bacterium]